ncbi:MAG: Fic family protein, partial [Bifidobacteriaceae bacterium]|nr:Fic family protein [Bifidobacteriaceae bacterium]
MLFHAVVDREDAAVVAEVHSMRSKLARQLRAPARWTGTLRRHAEARAISQSSAIEGYRVTDQDALAAVDGQAPREAEAATWKEIEGYRDAMTFVMTRAKSRRPIDESTLLAAHFMLLKHDLSRRPGEYRQGGIVVTDGRGGIAYTAPESDAVPGLMVELVESLTRRDHDVLVDAAMAHLNLVKIHPFRDGNGRMSRILQTAVLAQEEVLEP